MNAQLLVIDPQVDFCDPKGALYVGGAEKDMERLARFLMRSLKKISDIRVTLDSHRYLHIAHPIWWTNSKGDSPAPFTLINYDDVIGQNPKWTARNPGFRQRSIDYVKNLQDNKRYALVIWPPHCLIGSQGHSIYPELFKALTAWEAQFATIDYVTKGSNMFTEHYSAVKADVMDPSDMTTQINTPLIQRLQAADVIYISGEALSHCVANTVRDVADEFGPDQVRKFTLLEDTCSPVSGFENLAEDFIKEMNGRGMNVCKTTDL